MFESLTDVVSMSDVSDHDVDLLSLLNSQSSAISDISIEDSASFNTLNTISTSATNSSQDITHSSRISSPLKLSYIPETVSESEEENQISNISKNVTSVYDAINEALNQSTIEGISELKISVDPESIIQEEDTFEQSEGRKESLLDPINRLKELMNSQPPFPDDSNHLESLESNTENHSSQESLPVEHLMTFANHDEYNPISIPFDTNNNFVNISNPSAISEELSVKFRKKRVAPEALISDDIKQMMSRVQRTNTYVAKLNSLKQETTGLQKWININIGREPPLIIKNYRLGSHKTSSTLASSAINKIYSNPALVKSTSSQPSLSTISRIITENSVDTSFTNSSSMSSNKSGSTTRNSLDLAIQASSLRGRPMSPPLSPRTKTSNFLNISNLSRHNSFSKPSRPPIFMPPAVMNNPSANSPTSPTSSNKILKNVTPIKPRQRRLSFQAVTSRFSLGSSTPTSPSFPTTIEEKNVPSSSSNFVDEAALNKLCDVLPHADREVLSKYLCAAGGKDDLMAVDLYMRDLRNGEIL
ncbi:hypothetical protein C1645_575139 [Glomus cerebriforme]|uniref:CUE domain-containing protein n=1 Tax=Glomus cerebriforme TaxID=658196 RepID=A0A397S553_9GLOM|nr:hypothetical protein C1645_575139 [Glomus cerebriforme]